MFKQRMRSLRDPAVITAAMLSLTGGNAYAGGSPIGGASTNDRKTASPIKHVIVILGENRTFDHQFATYDLSGHFSFANRGGGDHDGRH